MTVHVKLLKTTMHVYLQWEHVHFNYCCHCTHL